VVVVRTIRICSAIALLLSPVATQAKRTDPSALGLYVRARLADSADQARAAVENYAAALTADPSNPTIALRAYREAVESGDFRLATRSAQALETAGDAPPDAHILLYVAALEARDWRGAKTHLAALSDQPGLGFMAPLFARWLEIATGTTVPLHGSKSIDRITNAYVAENNALIDISANDVDDAILAIKGMWTLDPYRAGSLRLAAASRLAERGHKSRALDLILGEDTAASNARQLIAKRRRIGLSVVSPSDGAAFVLARVAGDLIVEGSGRSALTMARMAAFAAPKNARIRLMVAGALAARKRHDAALAIADTLTQDPVYGDDAASFRIDQLENVGRSDVALVEAQARARNSPNDMARIGDIELRRRNFAQAAGAYQAGLDVLGDKASWTLVFAAANAHDAAANWSKAKPLLERALAMVPDEPAVLNELGYGLITHSDDVNRGLSYVTKAVQLRPDDAAIVDSYGWAQFKRGSFADAVRTLERAVRLDQAQAEIGEHLGDAYWAAARPIDARYAWVAARVQADGDAVRRLDSKIAGQR
jgi:predicted Zn-dependent protease